MLCNTCPLNDCCGIYNNEYDQYDNNSFSYICDRMIDDEVERNRLEYYDAWDKYIKEFYD